MFKVGQKVVAIKDHRNFIYRKGEVFTVLALHNCPHCGNVTLDIGIKHPFLVGMICSKYHKIYDVPHGEFRAGSQYFIPIQEDFQSISLTKVLEIETPLIGVN